MRKGGGKKSAKYVSGDENEELKKLETASIRGWLTKTSREAEEPDVETETTNRIALGDKQRFENKIHGRREGWRERGTKEERVELKGG